MQIGAREAVSVTSPIDTGNPPDRFPSHTTTIEAQIKEAKKAFQDRVQDAVLEQVIEKNESTSTADVVAVDASEGRANGHQVPGEQHR